ncbi:MAG: histidine kinase [Anaerocolumna sp.]
MKRNMNSWNLDKKIFFIITSLIYGISVIILTIFTFFYITSFIRQSNNISENQLSALAYNYEKTLDDYQEFAVALVIDDSIQEYLESSGKDDKSYFNLVNNTKKTLQNAINMHSNMNFIALISYNFNDMVYKGNSKIANNFIQVYKDDYADSFYCYESGTMRMSFNDIYLDRGRDTLNIYFPVYSITKMIKETGLLCLIFDSSLFEELSKNSITEYDSEVFLVDSANMVISSTDHNSIGTRYKYSEKFESNKTNFRVKNNLFIFQKLGKWNYYLVSRIPLMNMYRNNIIVVALLIMISVAITFLGLIISKRILKKTYEPLNYVVKEMICAAEGKLDVRIDMENVGSDFKQLAFGFNYMMKEINSLMEQVKLEQEQMNQIRFNALQSQIQPHFLYNTLDCIHWQAMAEGNEEISILVKALAQYYRLCLSGGKDIIRLEQEIEHVENYLIIQNIRYDNIIESVIEIDEICKNILIPKITLQPLVENSIYHGIKVKEGRKGELRISVRKNREDVVIIVADNGTGMTEEEIMEMNNSISEYNKDFGYGIRNVNKRIEILFGKEYGLHYEKNDRGGVTVTINLPCKTVRKYEEILRG